MTYIPVLVYDNNAKFLGYGIKSDDPKVVKLQTANLWAENEANQLREQIDRLNDMVGVTANWPSMNDPDVMKLVGNPDWEPLEDEPTQVVDEESSTIVENEFGEVDHRRSNIVTKTVMAPSPVRVAARFKKAQEIVARSRIE